MVLDIANKMLGSSKNGKGGDDPLALGAPHFWTNLRGKDSIP